jgi:hypothetical protein
LTHPSTIEIAREADLQPLLKAAGSRRTSASTETIGIGPPSGMKRDLSTSIE